MAEKIFTEFPGVSTQAWEDQLVKDLKGADYEKKLVWRTQEGFSVRPYYRAEDLEKLEHLGTEPGQFPYVRGTKKHNRWLVAQCYMATESLAEANKLALDGLNKGVEMPLFHIDGTKVYTVADMEVLLAEIDLIAAPVAFVNCRFEASALIKAFLDYTVSKGIRPEDLVAYFDVDPLKCLNEDGCFCHEAPQNLVRECVMLAADWPGVRVLGVSGYVMRQAGSSLVQELAAALAMGNEYMQWGMAAGIDPGVMASKIHFDMCSGSNYFMEIAKFRAARMLWARIAVTCGASQEAAKMRVQARTDQWNQTVYDMYVNLLRGTTETMSAAVAGVDSIVVTPLDKALHRPGDFSRRLARNTQIILKEEAHFDKVTDPAGGSYYIETLTASVANAAWDLFRETEAAGGYVAAFKAGKIQEQVKATAALKNKNIATRRETLLGVNQFPNFTEKASDEVTPHVLGAKEPCACCCGGMHGHGDPVGEPLLPYRGAESFELMRYVTEKSGVEPKAFMLTFGNLAMCRARAQFSSNFFAVAGIKAIDNNRFDTIEEGAAAALASGAQLVVACSADDEYEAAVPEIARLIGDKAIVVVAGDPACKDALMAAGITHFISIRNNVLETLKAYQQELGII